MITEKIRIPQYSHRYNSFSNLSLRKPVKNNFLGSATIMDPNELLGIDHVFIIAEPGHGKSTLISEFKSILEKNKIIYHFVSGVEYKGEPFKIIEGSKYFVFDALDETKDVVATFIAVQKFCKENELKLVISNRTHYLAVIAHLLLEGNFVFIELWPFSDEQILRYLDINLNDLGYKCFNYNEILNRSKVNSGRSILSVPRYLDEFCKYIKHECKLGREIKQLTKTELFEKVIYYKLETEIKEEHSNSNHLDLTKRVLERLSLVMEIQELNQISNEDFITFLDQTNSNISLIFLNLVDINDLLDRVMKRTDDILQFDNSEFQEYLAAKELIRLGHRFQTVYDLMIDKELQLLLPNWIDVLNFAIELQPEFAKPLITFIRRTKNENIDEKLIHILVNVSVDKFDSNFCDLFFNTIFEYYWVKGKSIYNIVGSLTRFVTKSNRMIFKPIHEIKNLNNNVWHVQSNQILIIEELAKIGLLESDENVKWLDYLLKLAQKDEFQSLQGIIFNGLVALGNVDRVLELMKVFENKSDLILNNYLTALTQLAPNNVKVIGLINRIIKNGRKIRNLEDAINNVSVEESIISIFNNFSLNVSRIRKDPYGHSNRFCDLFGNIERMNSKEVISSIEILLLKVFECENYSYSISTLIKQSLVYIVKVNPDFLQRILPSKAFLYEMDDIVRPLAKYINLTQYQLIEQFLIKERHPWRLEKMNHLVRSELEDSNEIYIYITRKYFDNTVKITEMPEDSNKKNKLIELRDFYLEDRSFFRFELIPSFVRNFEEIKSDLTESDNQEIRNVVVRVLMNYNPDKFSIEITEITGTRTTFNISEEIGFQIQDYFRAAFLLGDMELIRKYRNKLLKTLPMTEIFEDRNSNIIGGLVQVILPITKDDEKMLYDFFSCRTDDLIILNAVKFAEMVSNLELHELKPLLLLLVKNDKVNIFEKEEVLRTYGSLATGDNDKACLQELFDSDLISYKLRDIANVALIINYQDQDAIDWRFKELKNRVDAFEQDNDFTGMRAVSQFELEMSRPEFPNCLYGIENKRIYENMLDLLAYSFSIRSEAVFFKYSFYLQQIVTNYFKTFVNAKVISDLRNTVNIFPNEEQTFSFNNNLDELSKELYQQRKKEEPFLTAVQRLNHTLKKIYLPINSNEELRELIVKIFNTDIKNLIENGGFYKLSNDLKENKHANKKNTVNKIGEGIIQKTLQFALENSLLKHGLRKTDILREVESLDGLRYDYLISYGLYGPIMVELKLLHNSEIQNAIQRNKYKAKLIKYLGANFGQGVYAIFKIRNHDGHVKKYEALLNEYKDLRNLDIMLLNCN